MAASLAILPDGSAGVSAVEQAPEPSRSAPEFSARLIRRSDGRLSQAQLFVKGDRYRVEHRQGVKTGLGYASVSIVRLDKHEVWFLLPQRRQYLTVSLRSEHLLPLVDPLDGETDRVLVGEASFDGRPARLYDVTVAREVGRERYEDRYYEWLDAMQGTVLRLMSRDRDWSVEYRHVVFSKQPDYFFEVPLGYLRREDSPVPREGG